MSTISKTVRAETKCVPAQYESEMRELYNRFERCLNMFYEQYSGINSMLKIQNFKKLRNEVRQHMAEHNYSLSEQFQFSDRHWVMALAQCCSNLKSMWTNLGNRIKKEITQNENLTEEEKHYIRYVVSAPKFWHAVLTRQNFEPNVGLSKIEVDEARKPHLHKMICRLTRKFKPKTPKSENLSCMLLDQEMYKIYEQDGKTYLAVTGLTKGKRMVFELKSPYHYAKSGDVQLIYDKEKNVLRIHKCIQAKVKQKTVKKKKSIGVDKGYATLLSCSDDNEYGEEYGAKLTKQAEQINKNNSAKNGYRKQIKVLKESLDKAKTQKDKSEILRKIHNIERCNLGSKVFDKNQTKFQAHMVQIINKNIKDALENTDAAIIVIEDLSFEKPMTPAKGKAFNRKMSFWNKGVLDDRLEYIPTTQGIKVEKVNAAYTSQFCACCGAPITREGEHHEIGICPNCGRINANTNAAKNIEARLHDKEITLYTPHEKIRKILLDRYKKKIESQPKSNNSKNSRKSMKSKTSRSKNEKVA